VRELAAGRRVACAAAPDLALRPFWLLPTPQPLDEIDAVPQRGGPLRLLAGPERIESGWWDGADVARDYFVALAPDRSLLWVYRSRRVPGGWFLHGLFA
jgi:protein ImuB